MRLENFELGEISRICILYIEWYSRYNFFPILQNMITNYKLVNITRWELRHMMDFRGRFVPDKRHVCLDSRKTPVLFSSLEQKPTLKYLDVKIIRYSKITFFSDVT